MYCIFSWRQSLLNYRIFIMILEEVLSHLFFVRNYLITHYSNGVKNSWFLRNSSWVLQGFFRDSLGILHGFFMDSSWILQVFFRDSSEILQKFRNSGILQLWVWHSIRTIKYHLAIVPTWLTRSEKRSDLKWEMKTVKKVSKASKSTCVCFHIWCWFSIFSWLFLKIIFASLSHRGVGKFRDVGTGLDQNFLRTQVPDWSPTKLGYLWSQFQVGGRLRPSKRLVSTKIFDISAPWVLFVI